MDSEIKLPALFTTLSSLLNVSRVTPIVFFQLSSEVTSCAINLAEPPEFNMVFSTELPSSSVLHVITTLAPSFANSLQVASPIPRPPPVTIMFLFSKLFIYCAF